MDILGFFKSICANLNVVYTLVCLRQFVLTLATYDVEAMDGILSSDRLVHDCASFDVNCFPVQFNNPRHPVTLESFFPE